MAAAKTAARLNDSQVRILQALDKVPAGVPGLTTAQLGEKCPGAAVNSGNLGPAFRAVLDSYPDSLYGLGLVKPIKMPDSPLAWEITTKGRAAAATYKGRKRGVADSDRVPAAVLDQVVKKFIPTRTYGLELYTDADLKEVRAGLGSDYADVALSALRQQIVNRRKQGAFASKAETNKRAAARVLKEFGMGGTVFAGLLTDDQTATLEKLAGIDSGD